MTGTRRATPFDRSAPMGLSMAACAMLLSACWAEFTPPALTPLPPPDIGEVSIQFTHQLGGSPLLLETDRSARTTQYGQSVSLDELSYAVHDIALLRPNGQWVSMAAQVGGITLTGDESQVEIGLDAVPAGDYLGFRFVLGPESMPTDEGDDADPEPNDDSPFFIARGSAADGDQGAPFEFVVKGVENSRALTAVFEAPLEVEAQGSSRLRASVNVDRLFAGLGLSLDDGGGRPEMSTIVSNYGRMFTIVGQGGFAGSLPMEPQAVQQDEEEAAAPESITEDDTPPQIVRSPIDFADLSCPDAEWGTDSPPCVDPFVLKAGEFASSPGLFGLLTRLDTSVYASADGVVTAVRYIWHSHLVHEDMYELEIRPTQSSAFAVLYRHVQEPEVRVGQQVSVGDPLGRAGQFLQMPYGRSGIEFGVQRVQETTQRLCIDRFASTEVVEELATELQQTAPEALSGRVCSEVALVCPDGDCENRDQLIPSPGDVDAGRRVYQVACGGCHGEDGEGLVAGDLCLGPLCDCTTCGSHQRLVERIGLDMPPEGRCTDRCAEDVAAFLRFEFRR